MKRPIVCGGRDFTDREWVYAHLDRLHKQYSFHRIIQGGARGVDELARDWCASRMVEYDNVPADWKTLGNAAGPIRNQRMVDEYRPDGCIAFPGGRGTADMMSRAMVANLPTIMITRGEAHDR